MCVCAYIHAWVYMCVHACVRVCVCVCVVCVCVCVCVFVLVAVVPILKHLHVTCLSCQGIGWHLSTLEHLDGYTTVVIMPTCTVSVHLVNGVSECCVTMMHLTFSFR